MNEIKSGAKFFSSISFFNQINFQPNCFFSFIKISINILQFSTVWYGCVFWCRSNKSELFCCFRWFTLHSGRDFKINPKSMRSVSFLTKKYDSIHQRGIFWFAYCKNQVLCILIIKFMFSKKATKVDKIFTVHLIPAT